MGFLDRFKKQKEQEIGGAAPAVVGIEKPERVEKRERVEKPERVEKRERAKKEIPEEISRVIVRPLVTEKAAMLASLGQYVFVVDRQANRVRVGQAVEAMYGVKPTGVRVQNIRREPVRFGRRRGMQKAWKKAIVSLPKGKRIDVYEGV